MIFGNHIIGVGGTGSKCVEAMVYLSSCGLMPGGAIVSLFDQDQANGNLAGTCDLLDLHAGLVKTLGPKLSKESPGTKLFQSTFVAPPDARHWYWQPFDRPGSTLAQMFQLGSLDENLRHLARCLFNLQYEMEMDLTNGFRGRPSVGAAVIAGSHDEGHLFWNYVNHMLESSSGDINIFLAGSLFGGTGAAGLPTIARKIKQMEEEGKVQMNSAQRLRIACGMMLPYFSYLDPPPSSGKDALQSIARAAELPLRTQLALDFYARTLDSRDGRTSRDGSRKGKFFDTLYLLGLHSLIDLGYNSDGGLDQRNPAMLPELYAGLAGADFLRRARALEGKLCQCGISSGASARQAAVSWGDLPSPLGEDAGDSVYARLGQLIRFAFSYYYVYHPYIFSKDENMDASRERWYLNLVNGAGIRLTNNDVREAKDLEHFCLRLLTWWAEIGLTPNGRQWIDLYNLVRVDGYAEMKRPPGESPTTPPKIEITLRPLKNQRELQKKLADAFRILIGDESAGGLEIVYEGLSRQNKTRTPGYAVFVNALWNACAVIPPGH